MVRSYPKLRLTPTDPTDKSISSHAAITLVAPGYTFELPWDDLVSKSDTASGSSARFKSGISVLAMKPTIDAGFASISRKQPESKRRALIEVFGTRGMQSDYQFTADALDATPDQLRWWARTRNVRVLLEFSIKFMKVLDAKAIYRVGNGEVRGFEFVGSLGTLQSVKLQLFDPNDRSYEVVIAAPNTGEPIPQSDINAIVASFRPIPHS